MWYCVVSSFCPFPILGEAPSSLAASAWNQDPQCPATEFNPFFFPDGRPFQCCVDGRVVGEVLMSAGRSCWKSASGTTATRSHAHLDATSGHQEPVAVGLRRASKLDHRQMRAIAAVAKEVRR
jgi:hypothetical protein